MFAGIVNSINFGTWWSSKKKGYSLLINDNGKDKTSF